MRKLCFALGNSGTEPGMQQSTVCRECGQCSKNILKTEYKLLILRDMAFAVSLYF